MLSLTNIRRQLGPARKRLLDRLQNAVDSQDIEDVNKLREVRAKLETNMIYHKKLLDLLSGLDDLEEKDAAVVEKEIGDCITLDIEAQEYIAVISDRVLSFDNKTDDLAAENLRKQNDKLTREIELLKVETEMKRENLNKMTAVETGRGSSGHTSVKLPRLHLPKFDGKITSWPSFWDCYSSMIHGNNDVAKIDKFKYLLSCLEGEAKDTLVGFNLSDSQYDAAVKHLQERYDDDELIIHEYYKLLRNTNRSSNNTNELRKTFTFVDNQLRALKSMGENIENSQTVSLILSKFPTEIYLKLEEGRGEERWTVEQLRKTIQKLISARERSEELLHEIPNKSMEYTAECLIASATGGESRVIRCAYCEKGHWADECQMYKTIEQRKGRLLGRCYICLSDKHKFRSCASVKACYYCKKKSNHHSSLCPNKFPEKTEEADTGLFSSDHPHDDSRETGLLSSEDVVSVNHYNSGVIMKTASVDIINLQNKNRCSLNVLLDTGAKNTYITVDMAKRLGLQCGPKKISRFSTFGAEDANCMYVSNTVFGLIQKDGTVKTINAKVCKVITGCVSKQKVDEEKHLRYGKQLDLATELISKNNMYTIDLLIGNDYYDEIVRAEKLSVDDGLYLINSTIGWMFSGRVDQAEEEESISMLVSDVEDVNRFWELDVIGIDEVTKESVEEELVKEFESKLMMNEGGRYQVTWPWKCSKYEIADNYKVAEARLKSLVSSFKTDETLLKYDQIIQKQLSDGIIEEADCSQKYLQQNSVVTHYLPHHMIQNKETKKIRIVYEGCSKSHKSKKSLNDCLYRGKNMVNDLCGTLLRFRMNKVGLIADIEKAYLQLELKPEERDVTRFLWLKNINVPVSSSNIQEYRFCRVIWGIICSAFLLACTIYVHLMGYKSKVAQDLLNSIYVDNLVSGEENTTKAITYYQQTKKIFNAASMNMCKWLSNDKDVMKAIAMEDRGNEGKEKTLGMMWDSYLDELTIAKLKNGDVQVKMLTKRKMLQMISSIFDPLGLISPMLLKFKVLIQEAWKRKLDWDEEVPDDIKKEWEKMRDDVLNIHKITIPRWVGLEKTGKEITYELITFTDASMYAYAAATFLRVTDGTLVKTNLLFSKCRLAPMKLLSIPRLELLGVLIGCRASRYIAQELKIEGIKQIVMTDSKCVVEWCKSKKELKKFVQNKVDEIRSMEIKIAYVRSEDNPADIASRGEKISKLIVNDLWWHGPSWLASGEIQDSLSYDIDRDTMNCIENEERGQTLHEVGMLSSQEEIITPFGIIETKYSSLCRLVRVTAWCKRFINNVRGYPTKGGLTDDEIKSAMVMWTKHTQKVHFEDTDPKSKKKWNSLKCSLGVKEDDDGVLRCHGRFNDKLALKLLPKKSHFTSLVIKRDHRRLLHAGVAHTLSKVREEHWIIQGRSAVQKIIRQCLICIFWEGGPFKTPPFPNLPDYVINNPEMKPFLFVGVDYLGPLMVIDNDAVVKRWICLFTCINIRAIHLEVVQDATTDHFLMALRRFIARRGKPAMMISDNGSQFKAGSETIDAVWTGIEHSEEVQSYVSNEAIRWKFIVELAPWKGGFYERLIGLTKRTLKKSLGKVKMNDQQLVTIVTETEAVINTRPLVYVENDINSKAITPADFITLNNCTGVPEIEINYNVVEKLSNTLLEQWKKGQSRLNHFWKIWTKEYLQTLRERHTLMMKPRKGEVTRLPQIGEVVIVEEENMPRGRWVIGRIQSLIKSDVDDVPRAATLVTPSGRSYKRPFRLLYPLEPYNEKIEDQSTTNTDESLETKRRPTRKAAAIARTRISDIAADGSVDKSIDLMID